jgi:hypothetical protein
MADPTPETVKSDDVKMSFFEVGAGRSGPSLSGGIERLRSFKSRQEDGRWGKMQRQELFDSGYLPPKTGWKGTRSGSLSFDNVRSNSYHVGVWLTAVSGRVWQPAGGAVSATRLRTSGPLAPIILTPLTPLRVVNPLICVTCGLPIYVSCGP